MICWGGVEFDVEQSVLREKGFATPHISAISVVISSYLKSECDFTITRFD